MNIRALIMSVTGLFIAVGAVWAAMSDDREFGGNAMQAPNMVQLISARRDIRFGEEITMSMLAVQQWPGGAVPENTFTDSVQLIGQPDGEARRAKETIRKGQLLVSESISDFGESVTIVQALGSNSRAVAIRVDSVTAVGGFLTPGDYVDVVLTEGKGTGLRAATILQNIRILGVDQNTEQTSRANSAARTVTVEVAPREGQILALAQKAGTLSLTLRTERDVANEEMGQITLADLLLNSEPVVIPSAPEKTVATKRTVTVRRGVSAEVVELK